MKHYLKFVLISAAMALQGVCKGGVPLEWTRRPDSTTPANFTAHQGETLEFRCTFRGFGELPFGDGGDVRLYFQTNGMGEAWWSAPATVSSNEVRAVWGPEMDVGASRWVFFFGTPGVVYSSAIVRLVPSPGFAPGILPPPAVFTDAVAAIVTNTVVAPYAGEWRVTEINEAYITNIRDVNGADAEVGGIVLDSLLENYCENIDYESDIKTYYVPYRRKVGISLGALWAKATVSPNDTVIVFNERDTKEFMISLEKIPSQPRNALGLATLKDLEGISPTVPPSIMNDIEKLKSESTLVYRLFSGSNIVMEVTNYNSRVNPPAMKLERLNDKGIYEVMWTETNGLERTYNRAASNTAEQVAALDRKAAETYAPRGWSATTSGLGADAPKDTTWISTPTTVIAGGLEHSKVVTSSGQLWFLRSNGMVANVGGNSGGYFDISASDGTSVFLIEKTDSYMAPVDADGISVNGNTVTIRLSVVSADHPFLRYAPTLNAPITWQKEEDGFSSPIAVSWSGSSGAWVATVTTTAKEGFFQFEFFQEGGTKIKSGGAMDVSTGGILCTDGIHKCRPVYNSNGTITWEAF